MLIGQDRIRAAISEGVDPLLLFFANDASPSLKRRLGTSGWRTSDRVVLLESISRWELGAALGLSEAQVVALRIASRFAGMLLEDLRQEGDRIE
jgi:hypothetical protein